MQCETCRDTYPRWTSRHSPWRAARPQSPRWPGWRTSWSHPLPLLQGPCRSTSQSISQPINQSVNQACQLSSTATGTLSVNQSVSQSISLLIRHASCPPLLQGPCQSISQSISQSINQSVNQECQLREKRKEDNRWGSGGWRFFNRISVGNSSKLQFCSNQISFLDGFSFTADVCVKNAEINWKEENWQAWLIRWHPHLISASPAECVKASLCYFLVKKSPVHLLRCKRAYTPKMCTSFCPVLTKILSCAFGNLNNFFGHCL